MKNLEEQREEFITKAVYFICEKGFSKEAMEATSEDLRKETIYYKLLFSDIADIVAYFESKEDEKMLKKIGKKKTGESIRGYIGSMLKYRIKDISGGKDMLLRLKEYYLHIKHIAEGPKAVWNTSDVIWRAAGDKSLDMNYYSKRFLLSSVYTMSIKHYISDKQDIDEYIENALNKVVKVAQKLKIPKLEDIPILRMFS
jgi:ubiquinone biosynthesis protein COQ9